jgi:RNA polymerase sigma factor (sigma-70 family)
VTDSEIQQPETPAPADNAGVQPEREDLRAFWWNILTRGAHQGNNLCTLEIIKSFEPLILSTLKTLAETSNKHYPMEDLLQQVKLDIICKLRKYLVARPEALPQYLQRVIRSSFIEYDYQANPYCYNELPVSMGTDAIDEGGDTQLKETDLAKLTSEDTAKLATDKILRQEIRNVLHDKPQVRQVLEKYLLEGYSISEIAEELHCSREYVNRVKKNGQALLQEAFKAKGITPEIFAY